MLDRYVSQAKQLSPDVSHSILDEALTNIQTQAEQIFPLQKEASLKEALKIITQSLEKLSKTDEFDIFQDEAILEQGMKFSTDKS